MRDSKTQYKVKCPICGKEVCTCGDGSNITIKCGECNSRLSIERHENKLIICEETLAYKASARK